MPHVHSLYTDPLMKIVMIVHYKIIKLINGSWYPVPYSKVMYTCDYFKFKKTPLTSYRKRFSGPWTPIGRKRQGPTQIDEELHQIIGYTFVQPHVRVINDHIPILSWYLRNM